MNEVNKIGSAPPPQTNKQLEEKAAEQKKEATSSSPAASEESILLTELVQSASQDDGFASERAEKVEALKVLYQKGEYEINALQTAEGILNEQL